MTMRRIGALHLEGHASDVRRVRGASGQRVGRSIRSEAGAVGGYMGPHFKCAEHIETPRVTGAGSPSLAPSPSRPA